MLVVVAALLACAGASHEAVGPDTYSIDCKRSASNCYEEAGDVCPNGFDVLDAQGQRGAVAFTNSTANAYGSANGATAYGSSTTTLVPTYKGSMLVRCHPER